MKTNYRFCSKRAPCPSDNGTNFIANKNTIDTVLKKKKITSGNSQPYSSDFSMLSQNARPLPGNENRRLQWANSSIQSHWVPTCSEHTDTRVHRAHLYCHSCPQFIQAHTIVQNMRVQHSLHIFFQLKETTVLTGMELSSFFQTEQS